VGVEEGDMGVDGTAEGGVEGVVEGGEGGIAMVK
jgi:hypothetical protein